MLLCKGLAHKLLALPILLPIFGQDHPRCVAGQTCPRPNSTLGTPLQVLYAMVLYAIERTGHAARTLVHDVRVDHRRGHIRMAKQFLHCANVVACLEQMRCEGVAQRMATDVLGNPEARAARCTAREIVWG